MSITYRGRIALECGELSLTYSELIKLYKRIAAAFTNLGIKKNDIIVISMNNYIQAVLAFFAANYIGAVVTFLNPSATNEEIISYIDMYNSPVFLNCDKSIDENIEFMKKTRLKRIVTLSGSNINSLNLDQTIISDDDHFIDFNSLGNYVRGKASHRKNDDALILYTSGTTGKPKSVVLTNTNVMAAGIYLKNSSSIRSNKTDYRTLVCVPFSYPYGFVTSTLMSLLSARTAILAPCLSKHNICSFLEKRPNMIFGSPALLELIMNNVPGEMDLSYIHTFISGGDFLTPYANERGRKFFAKHNASVELGNGSGNAETVSCGTNPVGIKIKPETAGKVLAGTLAIIVDPDTLEEKPYGEEGLMCVSGKHVFKEYYKDPDLTDEVKFKKDGRVYFKTGTLGFIDREGYFTITSRQSRFYIMSSLNKVYCDMIQRAIAMIDIVIDCAVVAVPDKDLLFVSKAFIVKTKDLSEDEARAYILERCKSPLCDNFGNIVTLKEYEIPTYIEFVDALPRKPGTDKVDYVLLETTNE